MALKQSSSDRLLSALRDEGPLSPANLMSRLGVSQPTLFRAAKVQPEKVVALGGRRNRRLAALRTIRGLGSSIPVFTVSQDGDISPVGKIHFLHPGSLAFLIDSAQSMPKYYPRLPAFLNDMQPTGFMGNGLAKNHPDLKLPLLASSWNTNNVLEILARRGEDLIGNTLVGAESYERFMSLSQDKPDTIEAGKAAQEYPLLADEAMAGRPSGPIVGGIQPKFGALIAGRDGKHKTVIVKFSPSGDSFSARRWRDLLICESIALEILQNHEISASQTRIVEGGGRIFLEIVRFDRLPQNGRKRVLSLSALGGFWSGSKGNWAASGALLEREKKISPEDQKTIRKLECFARMIANNDRGPDNLSFLWRPGDARATLAPAYDMLPMYYAPDANGENRAKPFAPPVHDHILIDVWKEAHALALQFWEKVRADSRISGEFMKIAEQNLKLQKRG